MGDDDRVAVDDARKRGADCPREIRVELVGDDAADVVRLKNLTEVTHSSSGGVDKRPMVSGTGRCGPQGPTYKTPVSR